MTLIAAPSPSESSPCRLTANPKETAMPSTHQPKTPAARSGVTRSIAFLLTLAAAALAAPALMAGGPLPKLPPELESVRDHLAKYRDPAVAVRDGYLSSLGCVHFKDGAMGVHFFNPNYMSPDVDPAKPQILVYEPKGDRFELVAAEWFVPLATGIDKRPTLFGRPFDGPMAGHEPLMPHELHHYDLHVWLFKDNPRGLFASTNPDVSCAGYAYSFLEDYPPIVAHHGAK
jgi:hypothetical protein